jgi:protein ImuB
MRRIISLWFPDFPVERFIRARRKQRKPTVPPGLPFALVESGAKGLRLAAVNRAARGFGLMRGQRLNDARAAVPDLLTEQHEPQEDQLSLLGLARWFERYSPWVSPDGCDGLMLDATGAAHLFGGEAAMLRDMGSRLTAYGFTARGAFGPTIGAAWALARYGAPLPPSPGASGEGDFAEAPPAREQNSSLLALHPLPVEALRIDGEAARTLRRLGLKTIGSLIALPRASLARRFRGETIHENVLLRLDELLGHRHEPLNAINPPSSFMAHRMFLEPVISHEGLLLVLRALTETLARDLETRGEGALRLILKLFKSDGSRAQLPAGLSAPSHDAGHLFRLLEPKLDSLDAGFGIDSMTLEARETAKAEKRQHSFMEEASEKSLAELNDRLLNHEARGLTNLQTVESHVPERAERAISATRPMPATPHAGETPHRPLLIFDRPEPAQVIAAVPDGPPLRLTWRRVTRKITRSEGPERIAPEWWKLASGERPRDYYRIEDEQGRRYWIFRDGLYGESETPKWFVHGLSA